MAERGANAIVTSSVAAAPETVAIRHGVAPTEIGIEVQRTGSQIEVIDGLQATDEGAAGTSGTTLIRWHIIFCTPTGECSIKPGTRQT